MVLVLEYTTVEVINPLQESEQMTTLSERVDFSMKSNKELFTEMCSEVGWTGIGLALGGGIIAAVIPVVLGAGATVAIVTGVGVAASGLIEEGLTTDQGSELCERAGREVIREGKELSATSQAHIAAMKVRLGIKD
jgi:hypothetical protein